MAFEVEKKVDLAMEAEDQSNGVDPNDTVMKSVSTTPFAFTYPLPPTTEEGDRLAAADKNYRSPFPLITEEGYDPESLALEPYERSRFQPFPLHKNDKTYYPEQLALEPHEGGKPYATPTLKRHKRRALGRRAAKPVLRQASATEKIPEDTIVVDVGEEAAKELSQLRKALRRSEAKLAVAKQKTGLLAALKLSEEKLAAEEEKTVNFAGSAKRGRKRKASSEPEEAPEPQRRSARSKGSGVNYAE
jgi:hypothetical protein